MPPIRLPQIDPLTVHEHDTDSSDSSYTSDSDSEDDESISGPSASSCVSVPAGCKCINQSKPEIWNAVEQEQQVASAKETIAAEKSEWDDDEIQEDGEDEDSEFMPQSAENLLTGFADYKCKIQDIIMNMEYDPKVGTACGCNRPAKTRLYRCVDCARADVVCDACLLDRHVYCPFHWAEVWTGAYFERLDLSVLGLKVFLGHCGRECPSTTSGGYDLSVGDVNGIHKCRVVYCACAERDEAVLQLISYGLFPASVKHPKVAFTFNALRDFHTHTTVSKKSAYDYMIGLRKKTNNFLPSEVKVPSQQFIRIAHYWRFLLAERRSGQLHKVDDTLLSRPHGSFAVVCLACPLPGFNTDSELSSHYKNQKNISVDANFHLIGLSKRNNLRERAMWDGHGYVRKQEELEVHIKRHNAVTEEKSTCSRFQAIENANMLKHRRQNASGLVMILCRHGLGEPEGAVNLQHGERHINVDYALAGALKGKDHIRRFILSYDIGCQYSVKLVKRFEECFPEAVDMIREMKILVGKLHLFGHIESCQYGFSFNYTNGVGRTDGEEVERWWSEANQVAGSTKQMGPGHRCDTLDDIIGAWNWTKIEFMARTLAKRYSKALETYERLKLSFDSSDASMRRIYGENLVKKWEGMDTAPYKDEKGEWDSVYRPKLSYPSQTKVLEREALQPGNGHLSKARGKLAMFISFGMTLQFRRRELMSKKGGPPAKASVESYERDRKTFYSRQMLFMPALREFVEEHKEVGIEENIWLPSSFSKADRANYQLDELAEIEYRLREGEAYDALHELKLALREQSFLESLHSKYGYGKQSNTRTAVARKQAGDKKRKWVNEYQVTRAALISLGMDEVNSHLHLLKDEDMYRPSITEPHELGSGGKTDGWVWKMGRKEKDSEDWVKEEDRVLWFRLRASRDRWHEELVIVEEEFKRLIRGFEAMSGIWATAASQMQTGDKLGASAYAACKSSIFHAMSEYAQKLYKRSIIPLSEEPTIIAGMAFNEANSSLKRKQSPSKQLRKRVRK